MGARIYTYAYIIHICTCTAGLTLSHGLGYFLARLNFVLCSLANSLYNVHFLFSYCEKQLIVMYEAKLQGQKMGLHHLQSCIVVLQYKTHTW